MERDKIYCFSAQRILCRLNDQPKRTYVIYLSHKINSLAILL